MILFYFLLFFIASFVSFYIPGKLILERLNIDMPPIEKNILSWVFGISIFIFVIYLLSWVGLSYLYLLCILILTLYYIYRLAKKKKNIFSQFKEVEWIEIGIIFTGSLSFLALMFFSGWYTEKGMQFIWVNAADGIRHLAYIKSQMHIFPPQHPVFAGVPLRGFHYFYDFLIAKFLSFYPFDVGDTYFRFFPLLISLLYGASFYVFASHMTKSKSAKRLILFLAYFAQSSAFLFLIIDKNIDITAISVVQPIGLIVNPFTILSIPLLLLGVVYIPKIKENRIYIFPVALLLGILSEVKVYTGIIGIFALFFYTAYVFIKTRKIVHRYILVLILTAIVTAITFFPNNLGSGGLIFAPFLFYRHFMEIHLFDSMHWEIKRTIYAQHSNYIRIIILYIEAMVLFAVINFGPRIILFFGAYKLFKKAFWKSEYNILLFIMVLTLFIFGSLFVQSVSTFDTIQFFWIMLPILSIPSGILITEFLKNRSKGVYRVAVILLIVISIPGFLDIEMKYLFPNSPFVIPNSDAMVLASVGHIVPQRSNIVYIPPPNELDGSMVTQASPVIAALTGRAIYFERGGLPNKNESLYLSREKEVLNLHNALFDCNWGGVLSELRKIGTPYILTYNNYRCFNVENTSIQFLTSGLKLYKVTVK